MIRLSRITTIISGLSVAALVGACAPTTMTPVSYPYTASTVSNTSTTTSTATTTTSTTTTPTPTTSPIPTGSEPPISLRVGTVGYNATTVQVQTGQVLRIKFTPGIQDQAISGSGVYPQYSQLGVYITVNGVTGATQMLSNGLYTGTAQTSSVLDFSSVVSSGCSTSTCRQTITITIDHPNDDYWCLNYGQSCPWSWVYQTHPWHGTLTIETDDTTAI